MNLDRASCALMVIAVAISLVAGVLWLAGAVERPSGMFAGAAVVMLLAIAASRRRSPDADRLEGPAVDGKRHRTVSDSMDGINRAWLDGRVEDMAPMIHPDIVVVLPGFAGRIAGKEAFLKGFRDFLEQADIHEFQEHDRQIDAAGRAAVVSFKYEMVYERGGESYRATGRDIWVFTLEQGGYSAVWRTMVDVEEAPAPRRA